MARTFEIEVDGYTNLRTALRAAGYDEAGYFTNVKIANDDAEIVYVEMTNSSAEPTAGGETKGFPVDTNSTDNQAEFSMVDPNTTWLYAANPVTIKVLVQTI